MITAFVRRTEFATALGLLALAPAALAEGLRSPTAGTEGLGESGGRSVFVDDASASLHNPANLTSLTNWEAAFEPTIVHYSAEFSSPFGSAHTVDPWKFLPSFFVGGPLGEKLAFGLAISSPYGLSIEWAQDPKSPFYYAAPHHIELDSLNLNPSLALKLTDNLSLAAGFDAMWSKLDLRQFYSWSSALGVAGLPDGLLTARADGIGYSGNAALTWDVAPAHRVVFTARAPMDVEYNGHFTADHVPNPAVPGGVLRTTLGSSIDFPATLSLGYGWRATPTLQFSVQGEWVQFSSFKALALQVPVTPPPGVPTAYPENWRDTFTLGGGAAWKFAEGWTARASYEYFQTPTRTDTFSPTIPDANQNVVTAGLEYRWGRHRLGAAYSYVFYDTRTISNDVSALFAGTSLYNGTYKITVHLISASYGLSF